MMGTLSRKNNSDSHIEDSEEGKNREKESFGERLGSMGMELGTVTSFLGA
jgi:hypothetical protein